MSTPLTFEYTFEESSSGAVQIPFDVPDDDICSPSHSLIGSFLAIPLSRRLA